MSTKLLSSSINSLLSPITTPTLEETNTKNVNDSFPNDESFIPLNDISIVSLSEMSLVSFRNLLNNAENLEKNTQSETIKPATANIVVSVVQINIQESTNEESLTETVTIFEIRRKQVYKTKTIAILYRFVMMLLI